MYPSLLLSQVDFAWGTPAPVFCIYLIESKCSAKNTLTINRNLNKEQKLKNWRRLTNSLEVQSASEKTF